MSSMNFDVADSFESESSFVSKPGTYHVIVEDVKVGVGPKGNAVEGITVSMSVLSGTVPSEEKKTFNHTIFNPQETHRDHGVFARKLQSRFFLVTNLINPESRGQKVSIDLDAMVGAQLIVALDFHKDADGHPKKYLDIANGGMDVFHIDDPSVAGIPKDDGAIKLIPSTFRRSKEWFEKVSAKPAPSAKAVASPSRPAVDLSAL